jgi:hypothetical protein
MVDVETRAGGRSVAVWDEGDESGHASDGIFAGVLASYGERGYEHGYRRAISDSLALLLLAMEEYLRQRPDELGLRGVLSPFEEHLERHLHRLGCRDPGFVAEGLGI